MAESAKYENRLEGHGERKLELKSSAGELYDLYRIHLERFPKVKPDSIKSVEKINADVWLWTFVDVKCGTWKHSVTCSQGMSVVTWTLLEGDVQLTLHKPQKVEYLFSPNGEGCTAHVKLTYGTKVITVPVHDYYMNFICDLLKAADKYLQGH